MSDARKQRADSRELLALVQRLALPLDFGDRRVCRRKVAEIGGEIAALREYDLGDRQFHRDDPPVAAARLHLDPAAEHVRLARSAIARDAGFMRILHMVGYDEVADASADGLVARIAERLFGGGVYGDHHSAVVDDDDGVERGRHDGRIDGRKLLRRLQPVSCLVIGCSGKIVHAAALGGT